MMFSLFQTYVLHFPHLLIKNGLRGKFDDKTNLRPVSIHSEHPRVTNTSTCLSNDSALMLVSRCCLTIHGYTIVMFLRSFNIFEPPLYNNKTIQKMGLEYRVRG